MAKSTISPDMARRAAKIFASLGGSAKSKKKAEAARNNGAKGGRPTKARLAKIEAARKALHAAATDEQVAKALAAFKRVATAADIEIEQARLEAQNS